MREQITNFSRFCVFEMNKFSTVIILTTTFTLIVCSALYCVLFSVIADEKPIHVLISVKNAVNSNRILANFARLFDSVLRGARRRPLHWIVLTQSADAFMIDHVAQKIISSQGSVPVQVTYVDTNILAEPYSSQVGLIREYFVSERPRNSSRFYDAVFHLPPLFHRIFPFERVIALDADLQFEKQVDIADLDHQFHLMAAENLMSLSADLSPHYHYQLRHFRKKNPQTQVGQVYPGLQGFNTGVVLMNLDRMRRSELYNSFLNESKVQDLLAKYEYQASIAYQDLFTLIGMEHPQLFGHLDCTWNRQLDEIYSILEPLVQLFDRFHHCDGQVKVYHANGGSQLPDNDFYNYTSPFD